MAKSIIDKDSIEFLNNGVSNIKLDAGNSILTCSSEANDIKIEGVNNIDTKTNGSLLIGTENANNIEIANPNIITGIDGNLHIIGDINSGYIQIKDMNSPSNPDNGEGRLYKKIGNNGIFWKSDLSDPEVNLTTSPNYSRSFVNTINSPYTILPNDEIIGVDSTLGSINITLPQINTIGGNNNYRKYYIVDEGGNSYENNIIIETSGGDTINNVDSPLIINVSY